MANNKIDKRRLEALASKLKNKSEKAFDEIFFSTKDYLFYYIYGIVKNQNLADDILQETYIAIFDKISSYKSKNFLAWIITIAHNKAVNKIRKESKVSYVDSEESDYLFEVGSSEDELLLLKDMSEILKPEELRIVLMHVIGNYTHKQISLGLDIPLGTITWKYNDSMKKLRNKLEVQYEKR